MHGMKIIKGFSLRIRVLKDLIFPIMTEALSQETAKIFEKGILLSDMYCLKAPKRPSAFNLVESNSISLGNPRISCLVNIYRKFYSLQNFDQT